MPFLETDAGVRLAYQDRGDGPPVVLVHGWSMSSAVFDPLAAALPRGLRLVAPDLRGHGDSTAPRPFGLDDLAGDLAALLERLDLHRVTLVGWSLGAQVALAALPAIRHRVRGLGLVSATPRFTAADGWPHGLAPQAVEVLAHRVRRDPARGLARFFEGQFADGELDDVARAGLAALRARIPLPPVDAALHGLGILATADLRATLPEVKLPAVVVHGERDPICLPGAGRALAEAIPGARLVVLAGAGHAPLLSRPGAVAAALAPLLEVRA
jgi:pimeloyl-[acyl-carrier protein] methyl ester esterase